MKAENEIEDTHNNRLIEAKSINKHMAAMGRGGEEKRAKGVDDTLDIVSCHAICNQCQLLIDYL